MKSYTCPPTTAEYVPLAKLCCHKQQVLHTCTALLYRAPGYSTRSAAVLHMALAVTILVFRVAIHTIEVGADLLRHDWRSKRRQTRPAIGPKCRTDRCVHRIDNSSQKATRNHFVHSYHHTLDALRHRNVPLQGTANAALLRSATHNCYIENSASVELKAYGVYVASTFEAGKTVRVQGRNRPPTTSATPALKPS